MIELRILEMTGLPGSRYKVASLDEAVVQAMRRLPREEVPEMPDRIIASTALALDVPLITRDHALNASRHLSCVW